METMYIKCLQAGPETCMFVQYEKLVLHPRKVIGDVLKFVGLPWHENVMNHEKQKFSLSAMEKSTDQVVKPVYNDSLKPWVGFFDNKTLARLSLDAPMLAEIGYSSRIHDPKYEEPDKEVVDKYLKWKKWNDLHPNSQSSKQSSKESPTQSSKPAKEQKTPSPEVLAMLAKLNKDDLSRN